MALELSLRRFSLLPDFVQTGNEEPRKAHFLGKNEASPVEKKQDTGGKNDNTPKKSPTGKYRSLSDLTLSEVEGALAYFHPQLVASPAKEWLAKNYFCQIPLKRNSDERPPAVFGRIATCYPMTGQLENVEEMEVHFPRIEAKPDLLHIYKDEVNRRKPIESFCVGVKAFLSEPEMKDFSQSENIFIERGFAPLYQTGYGELLDIDEGHRPVLPWLYVFGSEWFATVPDTMQVEVKQQIQKLIGWNRAVLNYHPRRYLLQYKSLNDELEFNYGFTGQYLLAPQDTNQVLMKVEEMFGEMFMRGMLNL